ncbi:unnamed protein product [Amoebophrya sp. A120]|nr:unnamed protein product [Amoebophrya sp. A120]|eukprot:GSA120T00002718001.1
MGELWDGQSLILGQYKGVPVGLHFTLLILALVWEIYWISEQGGWGFFKGIFLTLTLWFTVFMHELGHVWMCRRLGGEPDRIILWPFGGLAYMKHSGDESDRTKILLAGPAMHIPLACIAGIFIAMFTGGPFLWYVDWCFHLNLQLFLMNLFMPAHPLDGCSLLSTTLLQSYSTDTVAKIYICLAFPYLIFLWWWGIAEVNFLGILLGLWLLAQTADLIIRIRQGPAGLAKHPMFTIEEQMKPKKQNQQRGVDISSWDGTAQSFSATMPTAPVHTNWGSGAVGGVPVVGVPTNNTQPVPMEQVEPGEVVTSPYVGGVDKKPEFDPQQAPPPMQQQYAPQGGGSPPRNTGQVTVEMTELRAPGGGSPQMFSIADGEGSHTQQIAAPGVEPSPREGV